MARNTGPSCRLCRREGAKLFLKGSRCVTDKCALTRREYAPGQHGLARKKESNYGTQMREKQKVKRIYGVLERQFRHYFQIAERSKEVTGIMLLQLLERRLDNVIFKMNLGNSRAEARQLVQHGRVYVNGKRLDIPSYTVKLGEEISVKVSEKLTKALNERVEELKDRPTAKWLEVNGKALKAKVTAMPTKEDVGFPIQEQLIVELYSK
ncbi:MAG: 30S ribosomal protein S4 [Candidatus Omnitrophica bacterium]|nr:30S ribosomal protein S4 [Candidatus Omnitrophota bacterium]MBU0881372.1 30S ribosomal protein S4 [Candidatus Omnitrophota bacterium]MBU0895807.1 30S ribosomal protein S4 [Candidatus Omnitrophota bacterium]MBU1037852.1 30S ribosomal protein S4 [Candidatus Omnitrophota bacterium]MBU1808303.1 30S ribosomal protein S4 [Candidatus Omnitrophota bacterium]